MLVMSLLFVIACAQVHRIATILTVQCFGAVYAAVLTSNNIPGSIKDMADREHHAHARRLACSLWSHYCSLTTECDQSLSKSPTCQRRDCAQTKFVLGADSR